MVPFENVDNFDRVNDEVPKTRNQLFVKIVNVDNIEVKRIKMLVNVFIALQVFIKEVLVEQLVYLKQKDGFLRSAMKMVEIQNVKKQNNVLLVPIKMTVNLPYSVKSVQLVGHHQLAQQNVKHVTKVNTARKMVHVTNVSLVDLDQK